VWWVGRAAPRSWPAPASPEHLTRSTPRSFSADLPVAGPGRRMRDVSTTELPSSVAGLHPQHRRFGSDSPGARRGHPTPPRRRIGHHGAAPDCAHLRRRGGRGYCAVSCDRAYGSRCRRFAPGRGRPLDAWRRLRSSETKQPLRSSKAMVRVAELAGLLGGRTSPVGTRGRIMGSAGQHETCSPTPARGSARRAARAIPTWHCCQQGCQQRHTTRPREPAQDAAASRS
jgi:hypothetical protein